MNETLIKNTKVDLDFMYFKKSNPKKDVDEISVFSLTF